MVEEKIFCCHGGLSPFLDSVDNIRQLERLYMHICMCVYIYVYMYMYIYIYIHTYICIHTHTHTRTHTHAHTHYIYICIYVLYICVYIYILVPWIILSKLNGLCPPISLLFVSWLCASFLFPLCVYALVFWKLKYPASVVIDLCAQRLRTYKEVPSAMLLTKPLCCKLNHKQDNGGAFSGSSMRSIMVR